MWNCHPKLHQRIEHYLTCIHCRDRSAPPISADQLNRSNDVLLHLDQAQAPGDLDLPGYRLHPLKGDLKGYWSVMISLADYH